MSDLVLTDNCKFRVTGDSAVVISLRSGTGIVLPETVRFGDEDVPVTSIGQNAFEGTLIQSIYIPASVNLLDFRCFSSCGRLSEVVFLPRSSALTIGSAVFDGCSSLKSFILPSATTTILPSCFMHCSTLATFVFEEGSTLSAIPNAAFWGCVSLVTISLPDSVEQIDSFAFNDCETLLSIEISRSSSLKNIDEGAFFGCSALKTLFLPKCLEQLHVRAFERSGIETVTIAEENKFSIFSKAFFSANR
jgi:hypothetical protein